MRTNVKRSIVIEAVDNVNKEHGYSLTLNRDEQIGKWFNFTLNSPSKVPGARVSWSGRNLAKASWHAHGYILDEILRLADNEDAIIHSLDKRIYVDHTTGDVMNNWQDMNIGSIMQPCYMSETSIL